MCMTYPRGIVCQRNADNATLRHCTNEQIFVYGWNAGYLRSIDRSCKQFYRLLIGTQAFCHFIEERSFGCDRLGTLTSRRSGDLAFFDECVQRIDEYDCETSFIEFDDVLPPRFLKSLLIT